MQFPETYKDQHCEEYHRESWKSDLSINSDFLTLLGSDIVTYKVFAQNHTEKILIFALNQIKLLRWIQ